MRPRTEAELAALKGLTEACSRSIDVVTAALQRIGDVNDDQIVLETGAVLSRQLAFAGLIARGAPTAPFDAGYYGLAALGMHDIFSEITLVLEEAEGINLGWLAQEMRRCTGFFATAVEECGCAPWLELNRP